MDNIEILKEFIEYCNKFHYSECPTFEKWTETQPKEKQKYIKQMQFYKDEQNRNNTRLRK